MGRVALEEVMKEGRVFSLAVEMGGLRPHFQCCYYYCKEQAVPMPVSWRYISAQKPLALGCSLAFPVIETRTRKGYALHHSTPYSTTRWQYDDQSNIAAIESNLPAFGIEKCSTPPAKVMGSTFQIGRYLGIPRFKICCCRSKPGSELGASKF